MEKNNKTDTENIETNENINKNIVENKVERNSYLSEISEILDAKKNRWSFKESIFGITAILAIICVVTVFIVALIHGLTEPIINKRLVDEKQEAIESLFGDKADYETITGFEDLYSNFAAPVTEAVIVKDKSSQKLLGYCVTVTPQGFADQIIMIVAVNTNITVKDTKILSLSETSGYGTKIESEDWFGNQFRHKGKNIKDSKVEVPSGENTIKTIAGATVSSKAFLNGVNAALDIADEIRRQQTAVTEEFPDLSDLTDLTEYIDDPESEIQTETVEGEEYIDE